MLALIGHNALFSYLTRLHKYGYVCPLHSFCEKEKYDKDECYDEPWNGKMCPMTIMGDVIHIKEKEVKIQFLQSGKRPMKLWFHRRFFCLFTFMGYTTAQTPPFSV